MKLLKLRRLRRLSPKEAFERSSEFEGEEQEWLDNIWSLRDRDVCPLEIEFGLCTVVIQEIEQ